MNSKIPFSSKPLPTRLLTTLLLTTLLSVSACSTMTKKDCVNQRWQEAGYKDATRGYKSDRFTAHAKACSKHNVSPNQPLYETGYEDGLQDYCTPRNGAREGMSHDQYNGTCPAYLEPAFLRGYIDGLEIALNNLERDYYNARFNLESARSRRISADSDIDTASIDRRIENLLAELREISNERSRIKSTISEWRYRAGY